jgi:GNAT superfamily N-acetyltransferase
MTFRLTIPDDPSPADREAVLAPLRAYNIAQAGDPRIRPVAILIAAEDGTRESRSCGGGLWGRIGYDWLFVELLAVPEAARGQGLGRALMQQAEAIAREAGCAGIWLDTYEFQARGFYERLGFTLFGTLPDHPVGQRRFFLMKRL